jgi:hypothetical protein
MTRWLTTIAGLVCAVSATNAYADRATADRCAAALPPASKQLYDKALPAVLAGQTLEDSLTPTARSMVFGGQLSISGARSAAQAAASCLEQAKS